MRRTILVSISLLLAASLSLGCGAGGNSVKENASSPNRSESLPDTSKAVSPAHKLAILQRGFVLKPSSPTVYEFTALLENMGAKFPDNSQEEIAEAIIGSREEISKVEKGVTYLEVAKAIDGCVSISQKGKISLEEASKQCVIILTNE